MIITSEFKPAWGLKNKHGQTIYRTLTNRLLPSIDLQERLELPDGDFVDLAWAINGVKQDAPLIVLLCGLGGNINSSYVAGLLNSFNKAGYRGVLMHFRGASGEPNRLPRNYHAGDTADLAYFLGQLKLREPTTLKAVVGISMGGNILLKWLGETGSQSLINAAVAVSVPFQLQNATQQINKGFARVYQTHILRGLRSMILSKLELINTELNISRQSVLSLKTLYDFDQQITAPLHGFSSVDEYYRMSSSRQYMTGIATPTLVIHALDDPFMTPDAIPGIQELSPDILLELSQYGGHVGFIARNTECWLQQRISAFFHELM